MNNTVLLRTALTGTAPAVWGTTYVVTTQLLPAGYPLFDGLMRALPAGLVAMLATRTLPRGTWWWKAAVLGVLNMGLTFPVLFIAAEQLPGGVAAILGAAQPLLVAVLAVAALRETPSASTFAWGLVGLVGITLVVTTPGADFDPAAVATRLVATASMALGVVLTKRWGRPDGVGATGFAGWQLAAGGVFLVPVTFTVEGAPPAIDAAAALGYAWLGIVGALLTYPLWFNGIQTLPVTSVAILVLLSPLVATGLGVVIVGETLDVVQLLGFVLALAAVLGAQLATKSPTPVLERTPA